MKEELAKEERKRKEEEEAERKKRAEQQSIESDAIKIPTDVYSPLSSKGLSDDGISYDFLQTPSTKTPSIDRQDSVPYVEAFLSIQVIYD